jgi:hypothetical protein
MNKRPPHKKCSTCQEYKYFQDYGKNKSQADGYHQQCKVCRSKYKPSPKAKARHKKYLAAWNRFKASGFTQEDFDNKLIEQNGKCAICGTTDSGKMDWCADHDHKTGQKRGLLCHKCNTGIGLLQDDVDVLCAAIDYLNKYKENL